jgi:hypothetical protein
LSTSTQEFVGIAPVFLLAAVPNEVYAYLCTRLFPGNSAVAEGTRSYTGFGATHPTQTRTAPGQSELSTGKRCYLLTRVPDCEENTRCCGLLLTCTTDSVTFPSAAVNRL